MPLPPLVPFPTRELRLDVAPEEWSACLDAWIALSRGYLLLPTEAFRLEASKPRSMTDFLVSYIEANAHGHDALIDLPDGKILRRQCFLLVHRTLAEVEPAPPPLLEFSFLADLGTVYARSSSLSMLLGQTWNRYALSESPVMLNHRKQLLGALEKANGADCGQVGTLLPRVGALLKALPAYGSFLMTGSDTLDGFVSVWTQGSFELRRKATTISYLALISLLHGEKRQDSLLLDHLYTLKAASDGQKPGPSQSSLLKDLVTGTPLVRRLQSGLPASEPGRARSLVLHLQSLGTSPEARPKKHIRRRIDKGKRPGSHGHDDVVRVHKMSLIAQVQDLFPDLGSAFIVKLLDEYGDDPEQVISHLLDDSLPARLGTADRSESLDDPSRRSPRPDLAPRSTPPLPPARHNIFDDDAFDKLAVAPSTLHMGRRGHDLAAGPGPSSKAAILSALAAFDSDDDERDDTYDASDVGGLVDATPHPHGDDAADVLKDANSEALFAAWKLGPESFARDAASRRSGARAALRERTGLTDEAIEGFAIMLRRDPRRLRRLEAAFETSSSSSLAGQQPEPLLRSRWRRREAGTDDEDDEDDDDDEKEERDGAARGRGGRGSSSGRARARGRGAGRGGGSVAGPADDRATQVARQRKDAGKASRANHNRRNQRAKKVARAGFPG